MIVLCLYFLFFNDCYFKTTLNESSENCFEPIFTETLVLLGMKENVVPDRVIDLIILLAKYYIF